MVKVVSPIPGSTLPYQSAEDRRVIDCHQQAEPMLTGGASVSALSIRFTTIVLKIEWRSVTVTPDPSDEVSKLEKNCATALPLKNGPAQIIADGLSMSQPVNDP